VNGRALLLVLCAAIGCGLVKDSDIEKRPVDYLSLNQCNRSMTGLDERVGDMEALLKNGAPAFEVLESVQQLRQDIVHIQPQCIGSDAATKKLQKLDKDLETLARRLEIGGSR
jgi:hypothetical protein